jgi:hypothetical protein
LVLLLACFQRGRHSFVCQLHRVLELLARCNAPSRQALRSLLSSHFCPYFQVLHHSIASFHHCSPVASGRNFVLHDAASPARFFLLGQPTMLHLLS